MPSGVKAMLAIALSCAAASGCGDTDGPGDATRPVSATVDVVDIGPAGFAGDLVRVGPRLIGVAGSAPYCGDIVTIADVDDLTRWRVVRPEHVVARDCDLSGRQFGRFDHPRLFTDGDNTYLSVLYDDETAPLTELFMSSDGGDTWRFVDLPSAEGSQAFPQAARRVGRRLVLAGSATDPTTYTTQFGTVDTRGAPYKGGQYDEYDAAVWVSDDLGSTWRRVGEAQFALRGNQEMAAVTTVGRTLVAAGVDSATDPSYGGMCCWFETDPSVWRSDDAGDTWNQVASPAFTGNRADSRIVALGLVDGELRARTWFDDERRYTSDDGGRTWDVARSAIDGVSPDGVLRTRAGLVEIHDEFCGDCTDSHVRFSADGAAWRDVTPRFPCGGTGRDEHQLDAPPQLVGALVATFGRCRDGLGGPFETIAAYSLDGGRSWRIEQHDRWRHAVHTNAVLVDDQLVTVTGGNEEGRARPLTATIIRAR
jgi:hypothetical protein